MRRAVVGVRARLVEAVDIAAVRRDDRGARFGAAEPGSPVIPPNGSYVHRFDKPGTYTYHCTPHPFMRSEERRAGKAPRRSGARSSQHKLPMNRHRTTKL